MQLLTKHIPKLVLFNLLFLLSSCATIAFGTKENVLIESVPKGASVFINEKKRDCTSQCTISFPKKEVSRIMIKKKGCSRKIVHVVPEPDIGKTLFSAMGSILIFPILVDSYTKAASVIKPKYIDSSLKCSY